MAAMAVGLLDLPAELVQIIGVKLLEQAREARDPQLREECRRGFKSFRATCTFVRSSVDAGVSSVAVLSWPDFRVAMGGLHPSLPWSEEELGAATVRAEADRTIQALARLPALRCLGIVGVHDYNATLSRHSAPFRSLFDEGRSPARLDAWVAGQQALFGLSRLQDLTRLELLNFASDAVFHVAASLRSLRDLHLMGVGGLTDMHLLTLAALTGLTRLALKAPELSGPAFTVRTEVESPEDAARRHFTAAVTPLGTRALAAMPHLEELIIAKPACAFWAISFAPMPALRTLELDTVTLRVGCDAVDFTPLAGLESLTLRRIGLSRGVATALVQLTQLRSLRLPGCYALEADTSPDGTALTLEPLAGVSRLQQLTELDVSWFTEATPVTRGLAALTGLRDLALPHAAFRVAPFAALDARDLQAALAPVTRLVVEEFDGVP